MITLHAANKYLHSKANLVGEDETLLTALIALVFSKQPVFIGGYAGTSKTVQSNAIWSLIETVGCEYQMGSEKAVWNMAEEIASKEFLYLTEFQKAVQNLDVKEMLKSFGEGRVYTRRRSVNVEGTWVTENIVIPPKPFMTTFADGNKDAEVGDEEKRRMIVLFTDPSMKQTKDVVELKSEKFSNPWAFPKPDEVVGEQLRELAVDAAVSTPPPVALPGFRQAFSDKIPIEFHDTRSIIGHFFNVISGVTRFYKDNRMMHEGYMLATPSDLFEAFEIYKDCLLNNCLRLENLGERVLKVFPKFVGTPDEEHMLNIGEVVEQLRHNGISVPRNKAQSVIANLLMAGWLEEDTTIKPPRYHRGNLAETPDRLVVAWGDVVAAITAEARRILPTEIADQYLKLVEQTNILTHPVTGANVNLLTYTGNVETGTEQAERVDTKVEKVVKTHRGLDAFTGTQQQGGDIPSVGPLKPGSSPSTDIAGGGGGAVPVGPDDVLGVVWKAPRRPERSP